MIMHWEVKAMKRTLVWLLVATLLLTALPAAAEEAATSDVYRTLYSGEITTLNYLVTTTTNDFAISANVIDTLVEYDRLGEVQPSLAESWSTSDDGLVWTFNLRKDATWVDHNGEYYANVTAHDFVAAAKYILNAQNASSSASILYDVIAGAEEYYDGTATPAEGEEPAPVMDWETVGVKAVDDYTLQYTLKNPVPYFLSMTTYVAFMPVNETFLNEMGANFGVATGNDTILYCGAYILSEFAPQEKRVLTKNESNWDADNVFIERIEQTYNKEASTISPELYRRGEIDSASIDSTLAADWLADPETADLIRPVRQSGFYSYFYAFNFDPHFDEQYEPENWKIAVNNENFRKSIFHALDKISAALPYEPDYPETILFDTITPPAFVSLHGEDYTDMGALGEVTAAAQFDEAKALEYKELAIAELTEAGATFPVKIYMPYNPSVTGWDGQPREGFVCYSLGNFISNQPDLEMRTTAILELELTKDPETGETDLTGVGYLPYYMIHRDDRPAGQQRLLVNIHQALADQQAGGLPLSETEVQELQDALAHCHTILGAEDDLGLSPS